MAVPPYDINQVSDSQEENAQQNIVNTYEVTYTVPSLNGYTSQVTAPKGGTDPVGDIRAAVEKGIAEVQAIYALGQAPPPAA